MMKQCYRVFISGVVQGVFFRESTRQQAQSYGLSGWVRNCADGRVEVVLCGEVSASNFMSKWLEIGPKLAKGTKIECIKLSINELNEKLSEIFEVRPTV